MTKKRIVATVLAALAGLGAVGWYSFSPQDRLAQLEERLAQSHPQIEHINPDRLTDWQDSGRELIILDVRETDEFEVSHISGAIRISPAADPEDIAQLLDGKIDGADIVFYCSVGVRSSDLAVLAAQRLKQDGAGRIANLRGGVFRWHNETRPLVSRGQATQLVHPYDSIWKSLVERDHLTAHEPPSAL